MYGFVGEVAPAEITQRTGMPRTTIKKYLSAGKIEP
jgi:predicted site-specific integrase-resolvase